MWRMKSSALPVGLCFGWNRVVEFLGRFELVVLVWTGGEILLIEIVDERNNYAHKECGGDVVLPLNVGKVEINCYHGG